MWLLTTLFIGPLGLVTYWISIGRYQPSGGSIGQVSPARRSLGSAAWAASGTALGGIGVLAQTFYLPAVSSNLIMQIAVVLLVPLFAGWLIFSVSRWISRSAAGYDLYSRRPLFTDVVSTCLVLAGLFPIVNILSMSFFQWTFPSGYDLFYAPLWGALCLGAIVGMLVAYPFHLWMLRRGEFRWGSEAFSKEDPIRELAWYVKVVLVVLAFVIMLGAIFVAMQIA